VHHTYRISKAAPVLSYLPRVIKIVRADFERSAIMPKKLINYPPLNLLLHKTPKNRISVLALSHIQSFILIPLVLSSPTTVTAYRVQSTVHTTFFKNHFFGLLGPQNVKIHENLNIDSFTMTILSVSGKYKRKKKKEEWMLVSDSLQ